MQMGLWNSNAEPSRSEIERRLISLVESVEEDIAKLYGERHTGRGDLYGWLDWAIKYGIVTDDELAIWRKALRVRQAVYAYDEHDRTLASLNEKIEMLIGIRENIAARGARLPTDFEDNVTPIASRREQA